MGIFTRGSYADDAAKKIKETASNAYNKKMDDLQYRLNNPGKYAELKRQNQMNDLDKRIEMKKKDLELKKLEAQERKLAPRTSPMGSGLEMSTGGAGMFDFSAPNMGSGAGMFDFSMDGMGSSGGMSNPFDFSPDGKGGKRGGSGKKKRKKGKDITIHIKR